MKYPSLILILQICITSNLHSSIYVDFNYLAFVLGTSISAQKQIVFQKSVLPHRHPVSVVGAN